MTQADQALASQVSAALNADPLYYYRHVNVRVNNGVAHLSGYVASADAIYHARAVALKVPGINQAYTNNLQLDVNGPGGPR
jgi:osmotically-inducible protein OsmY